MKHQKIFVILFSVLLFINCNFQHKEKEQKVNELEKEIKEDGKIDKLSVLKSKDTNLFIYNLDTNIEFPLTVKHVSLYGNKQYSMLPLGICKLNNIVSVFIRDQKKLNWKDAINKLSKLKHLEELEIWNCNLSSFPSNFSKLISLKKLTIKDTTIHYFPTSISECYNIEELNLETGKINTISKEVANLTSLRKIKIRVDSTFPYIILKLKQLEEIDLSESNIETIPIEIISLPKLKKLIIYETPLLYPPQPSDKILSDISIKHKKKITQLSQETVRYFKRKILYDNNQNIIKYLKYIMPWCEIITEKIYP